SVHSSSLLSCPAASKIGSSMNSIFGPARSLVEHRRQALPAKGVGHVRSGESVGGIRMARIARTREKSVRFDSGSFLARLHGGTTTTKYDVNRTVFSQGEPGSP